jgi:23S rRNA (uracil1939-C5)-methyltransferase
LERPLSDTVTLEISRLGARGDGIADTPDGPVFVPYALPDERVSAVVDDRGRARIPEIPGGILTPSPARRDPFCPYFFRCGGCATQHMDEALYRDWKRATLLHTLSSAGIDAPVAPMIDAHGAGRRRMTFHARAHGDAMLVGFMAARSHDLVPIETCPVSDPGLAEAPRIASAIAQPLVPSAKPLDIQVTLTEGGFDVDIRGHGPVSNKLAQSLISLATTLDLARVSIHGEPLVTRRQPRIAMGRAVVSPPPGGFLQATGRGEEVLAELALAAIQAGKKRVKRVADLFSGCGPFALRIAEAALVHAVESDAKALASLDIAARATPGLRQISIEPRDLFRRPLLQPELERHDAIVIDPPRAGCEAQAKQLAMSKVPLVISISCDQATFARDAAIMIAGGYRLESVTPVDQFKHTGHLEVVGVLRRG